MSDATTTLRPTSRPTLREIFFEPSESTYIQFIRYTVVGSAAFAVDFAVLFCLTRFAGLYYLISAAISFLLGLAVNYVLSRVWVFNHRKLASATLEFTIFAAIGIAGLGLNELGMWLFTARAGLNYLLAKIVTAALVYVWNFAARKYSLFR